MMLIIHIAAGGLAILLGAVALIAKKGGDVHRRVGTAFVYAMVTMGVSASILEMLKAPGHLAPANLVAAFMTIYFVVTAVLTVRPPSPRLRWLTAAGLAVATGVATFLLISGMRAYNTPRGSLGGVPFFMFFFLATILLLGAAGDVRVLRGGALRGPARLKRHLWRMCFAFFIAAGSFFSIRERVAAILPEPFTTAPMRMLPIALIFGSMFYWMWLLRRRRPALHRVERRHEPLDATAA
jgi:uncharacterized membrane protein